MWFYLYPWRFPIREQIWGRAAAGDHAATWVRTTTDQGVITLSWLDGHTVETDTVSGLPGEVALDSARAFLDVDVVAIEGLRLQGLRGILRRISGDPHETKWQAACAIAGVEGVAVHEVVRWKT